MSESHKDELMDIAREKILKAIPEIPHEKRRIHADFKEGDRVKRIDPEVLDEFGTVVKQDSVSGDVTVRWDGSSSTSVLGWTRITHLD
jgi:hypothetical protein